MNVKWIAFAAFVWFIGIIFGSVYEGEFIDTYYQDTATLSSNTTSQMTASVTFSYLFDFSNSQKETTIGSVMWKLAQADYYATWFSILTFDFKFLKDRNVITGEVSENLQSYFFKALGLIGLFCFVLMFIDVIQGFIPST